MSKSAGLLNTITLSRHRVHGMAGWGRVVWAGWFKMVKVGFVKLRLATSPPPLNAHYNTMQDTISSPWQEDADCQEWIQDYWCGRYWNLNLRSKHFEAFSKGCSYEFLQKEKYITECVCCYVYLLRLWFSTCSSHKSFCHRNSLTRMCLHDEVHKYISWQRDIMVMTVIKRSSAYFLWLLIYLTVAWLWSNLRGNCR